MLSLIATAFHASSPWPWVSVSLPPADALTPLLVCVVLVTAMLRFRHVRVGLGNLSITGDSERPA